MRRSALHILNDPTPSSASNQFSNAQYDRGARQDQQPSQKVCATHPPPNPAAQAPWNTAPLHMKITCVTRLQIKPCIENERTWVLQRADNNALIGNRSAITPHIPPINQEFKRTRPPAMQKFYCKIFTTPAKL